MEMQTSSNNDVAADTALEVNSRPTKKNKPKATKFRQQKLSAWQPILTASTVIPAFIGVGVCFIPMGIFLFTSSAEVVEHIFDYTYCTEHTDDGVKGKNCSEILAANPRPDKPCICKFEPSDLQQFDGVGPVYFYYLLSNFYQNHRRYVKSRNDQQLLGESLGQTADCEPFDKNESNTAIVPCGAIANSMFNDTFQLVRQGPGSNPNDDRPVPMTWEGVAWEVDYDRKFKNPASMDDFKKYAMPPSWSKPIYELDEENEANNGFHNVDFMVWMRTAALPTFRKLWRRLNQTVSGYENGLPKGNYTLTVNYNYPVTSFGGSKRFIIATTSWLGGKNSFLGVAYIVVGSLCIVLGFVFLVIHWKYGKTLTDVSAVQGRPA